MIRILHLEDNHADAELIRRELRRAGLQCEVRHVDNGTAFLRAIADDTPDLILSDYSLPSFDGLSAVRMARSIAFGVPFIFVSGFLGEERATETLREGATDYILKDRLSRLPAAVLRALRERDERMARERAEAAVAESEQRFRYVALATRDVIWDYDLVTGNSYVSEALRTQWGHHDNASSVEWWLEHIHPTDRPAVVEAMKEWLKSREERWTAEYRFQRGDGSYGYAAQRALALRDAGGRAVRVIGALHDMTESRRLQEQLERAQRVESLGRVAATIAHEFNNILMGIQPLAELIARSDQPVASIGSKIIGSVSRARRVVDEILRTTRTPDAIMESIDLGAFVQECAGELSAIAGTAIELVIDTPEAPVLIRGDRMHLQQVLLNLAANARDAMAYGGTLAVRVERRGGEVELSVSDTGSGMSPEILAHIFEPLFTTKRSGTGLGLAVCDRLLRANGARMNVESEVGRGTTFRIVFAAAEDRALRLQAPPKRPQSLRVLLVEDNAEVAEGIRLLLEQDHFETRVAGSGAEAIEAAEAWNPDLVVLDISLPDTHGTDVFDRISAGRPDVPVVFISGHIDAAMVGDRARRPNVRLLRKPFGVNALLDAIAELNGGMVAAANG